MLVPRKSVTASLLVSMLVGCAMSPAQFQQDRYTVGDARLCKTLKSAESSTDWQFMGDVQDEVKRRGLDAYRCEQIVRNQALAIGAGVLVAAAVVAAARSGGGGGAVAVGGGAGYAGANYDYDWEWDQYYGAGYALVWSCRGVQTGQFAEPYRCNGKMQTDWKWPAK
jgi:hypothetical protein